MEDLAVAGALALALTFAELDRVFYVPEAGRRRTTLYAWWWGLIIANSILASIVVLTLRDVEPFKGMPALARGVAIGFGYLALLHQKFATFSFSGKEFPFGIELVYDQLKSSVFKRINTIAKAARYAETVALADQLSLVDLGPGLASRLTKTPS